MASPTNLTEQLTYLRGRQKGAPDGQNNEHPPEKPSPQRRSSPKTRLSGERRLAPDLFSVFVYTIMGVATMTQLFLLMALDLF